MIQSLENQVSTVELERVLSSRKVSKMKTEHIPPSNTLKRRSK